MIANEMFELKKISSYNLRPKLLRLEISQLGIFYCFKRKGTVEGYIEKEIKLLQLNIISKRIQ
jgi:hypothetical protein